MCLYVCVSMYVYMYMHVSERDNVKMLCSIELKFGTYGIGQSRTNPTDFGKCSIYIFFYRITKNIITTTTYGIKLLKVF